MPFRHRSEALRHRVDVLEDELRDREQQLERLRAPARRDRRRGYALLAAVTLVGAGVGAVIQRPAAEAAPPAWVGGSLRLVDVDGDGRAEPTGFTRGHEAPVAVVLDAQLKATAWSAPGAAVPGAAVPGAAVPEEVATIQVPRIAGYELDHALLGAGGYAVAIGTRQGQGALVAFRPGDERARWARTLPAPPSLQRSVVHAERVVVAVPGDGATKVFAFTLDGDVAWTRRLSGLPHRLRGTEGRIYVEHGAHLTALDAPSGDVLARR
jgi:hypothetical protein